MALPETVSTLPGRDAKLKLPGRPCGRRARPVCSPVRPAPWLPRAHQAPEQVYTQQDPGAGLHSAAWPVEGADTSPM